jgi:gamma-glutamylcyclotransferase (GGCT)/AIG2-like uncharacterized protein YtfP
MPQTSRVRYFAYGSNIVQAQMRSRCPGALMLDTARLGQYRFIINRLGVATVVPATNSTVYGVLWELTAAHEHALDEYEGVAEGWYYKARISVKSAADIVQHAMIYLAYDQVAGVPLPGYLEAIVAAAEAYGFPATYVRELCTWRGPSGHASA